MTLEQMPLVIVKYCGLQEGFAQLAPRALFNVVGGDVPELVRSTVTIESLTEKGYRVKEDGRLQMADGPNSQLPTPISRATEVAS